jgi:hypothetical protein
VAGITVIIGFFDIGFFDLLTLLTAREAEVCREANYGQ